MANSAPANYKFLGWYIHPFRLFVICKSMVKLRNITLCLCHFFLLTYPECFKDADCSYGTCSPEGECACKEELIKEGRICKRGENLILQKYSGKITLLI